MEAELLIAAATETEIRGIRERLDDLCPVETRKGRAWTGRWQGRPLFLLCTGIGPERARKAVQPLLADRPFSAMVSIGYAGALKSGLRVGEIVIPEEIRGVPPLAEESFKPEEALFQKACRAAGSSQCTFSTDRAITTSRVICGSREKDHLGKRYRAGSVEMESAALARCARQAAVPFLVVRVILDEVTFTLPEGMQVFQWWRKKQLGRLLLHALAHPVKLARLLMVWQRTGRASSQLDGLLLNSLICELS